MAITYMRPDDGLYLQSIASLFGTIFKIVTVTGAGISTKAGIPVGIPRFLLSHLLLNLGLLVEKWGFFP